MPDQWSSVLATTVAGTAPPAATCPQGTNPDVPGPVDQVRPGEGPWSNQAAVFDTRAGRIVFIDEDGEEAVYPLLLRARLALERRDGPVALILSRQRLPVLSLALAEPDAGQGDPGVGGRGQAQDGQQQHHLDR